MKLCNVAIAGTQFTLYMAMSNFARVFAAGLVGSLESSGYATVFGVMGGSMLLAIPVLFAIPEQSVATDEPDSQ